MSDEDFYFEEDTPPPEYYEETPSAPAKTGNAVLDRTLPYDQDAEQALLSCCIIAQDGLDACLQSHISAESFYNPAHKLIFSAISDLSRSNASIDLITVGDRLRAKGALGDVGGAQYVNEIFDRVETTGLVNEYIRIVRNHSMLRRLIRLSQDTIEDIGKGSDDPSELVCKLEKEIHTLRDATSKSAAIRPITEFSTLPDPQGADVLLGENRYLCRGGGAILVSSAGMGKSSLTTQACICWGLGREFMGIKARKALKILVIQAEDDDGDIAEVVYSVSRSMELTQEDGQKLSKQVFFVQEKARTGEQFVNHLAALCRRLEPDLVVLNPLMSYIGGEVGRQEVVSAFFRNGLNRINNENKWAYLVVHHTTKPAKEPEGGKNGNKAPNWWEHMYQMAGSSDLINWARAILILEQREDQGKFWLRLAKRGERAGVKALNENSTAIVTTTKIPIEHCRESVELEDGRNFNLIVWKMSDAPNEQKEKSPGPVPKADADEIIRYIPRGIENAEAGGRLYREVDSAIGCGKTTFYKHMKSLREAGLICQDEQNRYYRKHNKDIDHGSEA